MQANDTVVMCEYRDGNDEAFNTLYERFYRDVRSIIRKYAPKDFRSEIDDICQQFWLGLVRYRHTYDGTSDVRVWLLTMARNALAAYYRSETQKKRLTPSTGQLERFNEDHDGYSWEKPEAALILAEDFDIACDAITQLRPEYRDVITAIYLLDMTPAEYAQQQGIKVTTVYTQIERALDRLRPKVHQALTCA